MKLKIVSYNIHKGFTFYNFRFILSRIKNILEQINPDLALLQEVLGEHTHRRRQIDDWETNAQFEYLADAYWPHYSYGKNAVYSKGHHGNAILSKYPIQFNHNEDLTLHRFEQRGLLHCRIEIPDKNRTFHALTTHINLLQKDRNRQLKRIVEYLQTQIPLEDPLLLTGDFNDWRKKISPLLEDQLGLKEAFLETHQRYARTFPSFFPLFPLDRIYFRHMEFLQAETFCHKTWRGLSDHLGIIAEFEISERRTAPP